MFLLLLLEAGKFITNYSVTVVVSNLDLCLLIREVRKPRPAQACTSKSRIGPRQRGVQEVDAHRDAGRHFVSDVPMLPPGPQSCKGVQS